VFDAGATDTGRPYFVMELVRGIKITEYCDKNHLDTLQLLPFCWKVHRICSVICDHELEPDARHLPRHNFSGIIAGTVEPAL
jgi:hypothetical protein